ncbi:MAG TPA: ABC transporter substrate-binding protein [Stellaceae bacterium]|nr:ABC transporter substrate-binding protein [Stellaceae bacterium]
MISRRLILAAALAAAAALPLRLAAAESSSPAATVSSFYDTLLGVMKEGPALGFRGRVDRLAPDIRRSFNFALMTRLMVGLQWANLTPEQQQRLVAAFSDFSIAIYASRFDDYSGERFEVDPNPTPTTGGVVVHSKLVKSDGEPVELDYLMHEANDAWQIVDVYLSGTVSELATRRSEFSSVMRNGGPEALVDLLQKKAAELRG